MVISLKTCFISFRQVSWVRKSDYAILTSARLVYTNDPRFAVLHATESDDWLLQLKYAKHTDAGLYECQVFHCRGGLIKPRGSQPAVGVQVE